MKIYKVNFEYITVYYYTEKVLTEKIAIKLGSQCFGLRKSMGNCKIEFIGEDKDIDYKDITLLQYSGDVNIFKGTKYIENTAYLCIR